MLHAFLLKIRSVIKRAKVASKMFIKEETQACLQAIGGDIERLCIDDGHSYYGLGRADVYSRLRYGFLGLLSDGTGCLGCCSGFLRSVWSGPDAGNAPGCASLASRSDAITLGLATATAYQLGYGLTK